MKNILLFSDNHGYVNDIILKHCSNADEIWHAGDWLSIELSNQLSKTHLIRGVYGNADGKDIRDVYPLHNKFEIEGLSVWMTHIGGYPGKYNKAVENDLLTHTPDIFICGHSHILRIERDKNLNNMLYINPGASGLQGFHKRKTLVRFKVDNKRIFEMDIIEF